MEEVAEPAAGVREQVPERDRRGDAVVTEPQLGQIRAHRHVEGNRAPFDQPHERGRGDGLGDRADLKERVAVDRQGMIDVRDAEALDRLFAVRDEPDGDAGNRVLAHRALDHLVERTLSCRDRHDHEATRHRLAVLELGVVAGDLTAVTGNRGVEPAVQVGSLDADKRKGDFDLGPMLDAVLDCVQ